MNSYVVILMWKLISNMMDSIKAIRIYTPRCVLDTDIRRMGHAPYAGSMPTTQGGKPLRRVHPRYASYGRFHANTQVQMIIANAYFGASERRVEARVATA